MGLARQQAGCSRLCQVVTQHPGRRLGMASDDTAYDRGGSRAVV